MEKIGNFFGYLSIDRCCYHWRNITVSINVFINKSNQYLTQIFLIHSYNKRAMSTRLKCSTNDTITHVTHLCSKKRMGGDQVCPWIFLLCKFVLVVKKNEQFHSFLSWSNHNIATFSMTNRVHITIPRSNCIFIWVFYTTFFNNGYNLKGNRQWSSLIRIYGVYLSFIYWSCIIVGMPVQCQPVKLMRNLLHDTSDEVI